MMGLWADGWFYISSAGLLVSAILFFFLLGQYRVASEAADVTDGERGADKEASAPAAIRPVYIPDEAPTASVASHPLREPQPKPEAKASDAKPEYKPKTEGEYAGPERRRDSASTTGGISPAVVYLQNIKGELSELHQEMRALAKRVDDELASVSTRDEALIDRLGELARVVENMKAPAATADEPVQEKVRKVEKAPEPAPVASQPEFAPACVVLAPAPVVLALAPEPEPTPASLEPARSPDETIRMELGSIIAAPPAEPQPQTSVTEPTEQIPEPAPPEEKPRRGPVWPV